MDPILYPFVRVTPASIVLTRCSVHNLQINFASELLLHEQSVTFSVTSALLQHSLDSIAVLES